jgi:membrane-associated two-gene conflict system component 1 (EACC1)
MTLPPILIEALASVVATAVASGIVAPLAFTLKRFVRDREHTVSVRLPNGKEVRLELDDRVSPDRASELIQAAITSANLGDEAAVKRTIEVSHAVSQQARGAAR